MRFDSHIWRQILVEIVGSLRCPDRFFSGVIRCPEKSTYDLRLVHLIYVVKVFPINARKVNRVDT